jgi:ferredoxin-thioredoxin reductase catalytic subunit
MEEVCGRAETDARTYGYYLYPDPQFLHDLVEGLKKKCSKYGYLLCPCRVGSGKFELDRDIFCPCDYRDADVQEYGCCFYALYVRDFHGHRSMKNTEKYVNIERKMFADYGNDEFTAKVTSKQDEAITILRRRF